MRTFNRSHFALVSAAAAALLAPACSAAPADHEHAARTSSAVVTELAWSYRNNPDYKDVQQIALVPEADGRLTAFELMTDGTLWRESQTSPGAGWGPITDMGAHSLREFSALPNADGRIEVFALGGDQVAYHIWETAPNGPWGGWASLGGSQINFLTATRNADGRLEAFCVGGDRAVWHTWQQGAPGNNFGDWVSLGGWGIQLVQAARDASGAINVFAIGGDGLLYSIAQGAPNGGFNGWTRPLYDNTQINAVVPAANQDGRLELIVRRTDGEMMHTWQTSPNGPYYGSYWDYGFSNVSDFTVGSEADGRLKLVGVQNQGIYEYTQVAPNSSWTGPGALAYSGTESVHVGLGNNANGALALLASTHYLSQGSLYEAAPNGPWATNQVYPVARVASLDVPSASYSMQPFDVRWQLSTDAYCQPSVKISAYYLGSNKIIFQQSSTQTTGTFTVKPPFPGTVLVEAEPQCTNGAHGPNVIKQDTVSAPPAPPTCPNGSPPQNYVFCVTFPDGLCGDSNAYACSEEQAQTIVTSEEDPDATVTAGACQGCPGT